MSERNFRKMLEAQWDKGNFVCVGLDSDIDKVLEIVNKGDYLETMCSFNRDRIEATRDLVCAFKINIAFYENRGNIGWFVLETTVKDIHKLAPDVPVILDAKTDIGHSNLEYVYMAFNLLKVDAITVNPYLGAEALKPFLEQKGKGIIVLCRTSNPGAGEFQDLLVKPSLNEAKSWGIARSSLDVDNYTSWDIEDDMPLYQYVAYRVSREWNKNGNCALVVGATYPKELREVRKIVGDMPILIPGIGAQGGDIEKTVNAGKDSRGQGMIINSSRGIIFAKDPRQAAIELHNLINRYR